MLHEGSNYNYIWRRVGKAALAVILAITLCPGSRELLVNAAFADSASQKAAVFGEVSDVQAQEDEQGDAAKSEAADQGEEAAPGDAAADEDAAGDQKANADEAEASDEATEGAVEGDAGSGESKGGVDKAVATEGEGDDGEASADADESAGSDDEGASEDTADKSGDAADKSKAAANKDEASAEASDPDASDEGADPSDEAADSEEAEGEGEADADDKADKDDKDDEPAGTLLEATVEHDDDIHVSVEVDPSVELPEDAQLVVTSLIEREDDIFADEEEEFDDEGDEAEEIGEGEYAEGDENAEADDAEDVSDDSEAADEGDEEAADAGDDADDENADEADDESAYENADAEADEAGDEADESDEADEGDNADANDEVIVNEVGDADDEEPADSAEPEADESDADDEEPEATTGASFVLSRISDAIQTYLQKEDPEADAPYVGDAFIVEVVDGNGSLIPLTKDQAKLTFTITDPDRASEYESFYAVDRQFDDDADESEEASGEDAGAADEAANDEPSDDADSGADAADDAKTEVKTASDEGEPVDNNDAKADGKEAADSPAPAKKQTTKVEAKTDAMAVSAVAKTQYGDEETAANVIDYKAKATAVADDAQQTDEETGTVEITLDGTPSIAATSALAVENASSVGAPTTAEKDAASADEPEDEGATLIKKERNTKLKAAAEGGPLRAPATDSRPKKDTIDTTAYGMTINLFNYEAVDVNSQNTYGGTTSYTGINENRNKYNELHFFASGTANSNNVTQNGINQFTGERQGGGNWSQQYANQGIVKSQLSGTSSDDSKDRYPVLNSVNRSDSNNDKSTEYLFNPSKSLDRSDKRTTYANVTNLFYLQNAGTQNEMLVYDSNDAYAYYDVDQGDNGSFTVYDGTFKRKNDAGDGMMVGFFPFDYPKDEWWDQTNPPEINATRLSTSPPVDHHLGMTLNVPFNMPYDGKIRHVSGGNTYDSNMVFDFSGDDDMWVFVDGKLVLDIGGIHQPVRGKVDFNTGIIQILSGTKVEKNDQGGNYTYTATGINGATDADKLVRGSKVYLWNVYGTELNPQFSKSYEGEEPLHEGIFGDHDAAAWRAGTEHTLQAFYLERGGCDSNLKISTNIHLATPQTASVQKEWVDTDNNVAKKTPVKVELIRKAVDYSSGELVGYALVDTQTLSGDTVNDDTWAHKWANLPTSGYNPSGIFADYNSDGSPKGEYDASTRPNGNRYCSYTYLVRELPVEGYVTSYAVVDGKTYKADDLEMVGELNKKAVSIFSPTLKGISDSESDPITGVTLQYTTKERSDDATPSEVQTIGQARTLNNDNLWQIGYDGLTAWTKDGDTYTDYTYASSSANTSVAEVSYRLGEDSDAPKNAAAVPANATVKVTNTPITLNVEKKWLDASGRPDNASHADDTVYVQLQKQTYNSDENKWNTTWEDVDDPVALNATKNWKTKYIISNNGDVRYRVLEGTMSGEDFMPSKVLTTSNGKTFTHVETAYTHTGTWWLDTETTVEEGEDPLYEAEQNGTTLSKSYYWTTFQVGVSPNDTTNYIRTFDNRSEVMEHAGTADEKFKKDKITVVLTIPALAASIPSDPNNSFNYVANISLGDNLKASMTEPEQPEGAPSWDVEASSEIAGFNADAQVVKSNENGTLTVTVPAATAKANAGKTITLTIPVEGNSTDDLSKIVERKPATVTVSETRYISRASKGEETEYTETSGDEYVLLSKNDTSANAVITNKPLTVQLTVKKTWSDGYDKHDKESVWVRVLKDGQPVTQSGNPLRNPVELKKNMGENLPSWEHTFEGLEPGGTYTIQEGVMENGAFKPVGTDKKLVIVDSDNNTKSYALLSTKYYSADDEERVNVEKVVDGETGEEVEKKTPIGSLDGTIVPNAGTAVVENGGAELRLIKTDADTKVDETTGLKSKLEGAKFKLYKDVKPEGATEVTFNKDDDIKDANLVKKTTGTAPDETVISEFTTDENGFIEFPMLESGFYWLVETGAPTGYLVRDTAHPVGIELNGSDMPHVWGVNPETGAIIETADDTYDTDKSRPVVKVVDADGKIVMWDDDDNPETDEVEKTEPTEEGEVYALVFPDMKTYALPSTGGPGALPFLFAGAFIATLAAGGGFKPRRFTAMASRPARHAHPRR